MPTEDLCLPGGQAAIPGAFEVSLDSLCLGKLIPSKRTKYYQEPAFVTTCSRDNSLQESPQKRWHVCFFPASGRLRTSQNQQKGRTSKQRWHCPFLPPQTNDFPVDRRICSPFIIGYNSSFCFPILYY